ncbi:unnamed protein product [Brachionus calyciflorus]|uniref:Uncharacterized protein n=1 Tax=Brachionus calyciflorus TaxID=104777 RepID=A0A814M2D6_9BILA|nr:unnamed protein product [Brachionus calyciflorus]
MRVSSYNCKYFSTSKFVVDKILDNCDILFLCEHWLCKEEDYLIKSRYPNHNLYFQSDMDLALSDKKKDEVLEVKNLIEKISMTEINSKSDTIKLIDEIHDTLPSILLKSACSSEKIKAKTE